MKLNSPIKKVIRTTARHLRLLEKLEIKSVGDLINYFPRNYSDSSEITELAYAKINQLTTFKGKISHLTNIKAKTGKILTKAVITDRSGMMEIVWFNQTFITRILKEGSMVFLSGKPKIINGRIMLSNPSYEQIKSEQLHTARIIPIYHETESLSSKWLREKIALVLNEAINEIEEYLPESIIRKYNLMPIQKAVKEIHFPKNEFSIDAARLRLGFDELLFIHLKSLIAKLKNRKMAAGWSKAAKVDYENIKKFIEALPFTLTKAQKISAAEILKDIQKPFPMSRLMQGDVGSGKTVVAAIAAFAIIKNGMQAAFLAPTEILAQQHCATLKKFLEPHGIKCEILTGSTTAKKRKIILQSLTTGDIRLIIGTHVLIQPDIKFQHLGLAVIDEQHKFGVRQRAMLNSHGRPHILNLSATPIPRTLALTLYGDQDLSIIDEMPPGRKIIMTRIVPENKRQDAYDWIRKQIKEKSQQAFVVCPLIDESDKLELKAVEKEYERLANSVFPDLNVSFIHGRLPQQDKNKIMEDFRLNKINILISTSVIEVGIDVKNATIMIIEGAERFGLAQLHQFRGRIGRGDQQSYCLLFTNTYSEQGIRRLHAMTRFHSGFRLAEIDLSMRGPGEVFGVRQSGIPDLKMASLTDNKLIAKVHEAAAELIAHDSELNSFPKLKNKISEFSEIHA